MEYLLYQKKTGFTIVSKFSMNWYSKKKKKNITWIIRERKLKQRLMKLIISWQVTWARKSYCYTFWLER
jgi:hypothetical protein